MPSEHSLHPAAEKIKHEALGEVLSEKQERVVEEVVTGIALRGRGASRDAVNFDTGCGINSLGWWHCPSGS